jgi:hypothetical protein
MVTAVEGFALTGVQAQASIAAKQGGPSNEGGFQVGAGNMQWPSPRGFAEVAMLIFAPVPVLASREKNRVIGLAKAATGGNTPCSMRGTKRP